MTVDWPQLPYGDGRHGHNYDSGQIPNCRLIPTNARHRMGHLYPQQYNGCPM